MVTVTLDWTEHAPPGFTGGAVTVGNFDGVHRGHRALVASAASWARRFGGPALAVTFDPPPYQVLFPDAPPRPPLTTLADRANLLLAAGASHVVVLRTTAELLALTPEAFCRQVLQRLLGARAVIEGYNFRFGRGRTGDTAALRRLCEEAAIAFEEVPPCVLAGEPVSSSRVRAALLAGDVSGAAELLGRPYRIAGTVVAGARRGRTIGFPTANLGDVRTVLPGNGVYAARATVDGKLWPAAANVGPNPTFGEDARKIEAHLIGFSGDLYSRPMAADFVARLRGLQTFAGPEALAEQLRRDVAEARRLARDG